MKKSSNQKLWTGLIVLASVALVVLPVVFGQFRAELARWHLAAATNALTLESGPVEPHLQEAQRAYPQFKTLRDYWLLQIKIALVDDVDSVSDVFAAAIEANPQHVSLANYASVMLWKLGAWDEQLHILEMAREGGAAFDDSDLNQLAYLRSLVVGDLDQALEEVNQALAERPNEPSYRDTRAWIYYHMQRLDEALADADYAVKRVERLQEPDGLTRSLDFLFGWLAPPEAPKSKDDDPKRTLTRREAGDGLWVLGALHYHRAKILDALGRTDEAQADWDWLTERRLPHEDLF
ncbi:MAG: hypothetical protein R3C53_21765 [Pirellulaceae bacterium]